jgi:hypothetical protein
VDGVTPSVKPERHRGSFGSIAEDPNSYDDAQGSFMKREESWRDPSFLDVDFYSTSQDSRHNQ